METDNETYSLNDLSIMWDKDARLDDTEPAKEAARISKMHAKYLKQLALHSVNSKKCSFEYTELRALKFEYYSGKLNNKDDMKRYGWPPFQDIVSTKEGKDRLLDADPQLQKILIKKMMHDECVEFIKLIIKELNNRTWQIKIISEWNRYTGVSPG
jgi:hypothetical protein